MRISDWSSDVCSSDLGKTGIAGLRAKPVGEGRREPARELARANRRRVEFGKLDEPPGEAVMEKDAVAMLYGGSGGGLCGHERNPCLSGRTGQCTDPSCAKMASGLISWCSPADRKSTRLNSSH